MAIDDALGASQSLEISKFCKLTSYADTVAQQVQWRLVLILLAESYDGKVKCQAELQAQWHYRHTRQIVPDQAGV